MRRVVFSAILFSILANPCFAQGWSPWAEEAFGDRSRSRYERPYRSFDENAQASPSDPVRDGGPRPPITPQAPPIVPFAYNFPSQSIVIDTSRRKLYYVLGDNRAYEYPIAVGREGFNWTGTEAISRKQDWPDWHPPEEMRERDPKLPEKMTGGVHNPLGAMALYLGKTLYRIHGTNDAKSIGQAQSSGCFRMMNSAVLHLAGLAEIGTIVTVVGSLPKAQEVSRASEPAARNLDQVPAQPSIPSGATTARRNEGLPLPSDYRALRDYTLGR